MNSLDVCLNRAIISAEDHIQKMKIFQQICILCGVWVIILATFRWWGIASVVLLVGVMMFMRHRRLKTMLDRYMHATCMLHDLKQCQANSDANLSYIESEIEQLEAFIQDIKH